VSADTPEQGQLHFLVFELDGQFYGIDVEQIEAIVEGECCDGLWFYEGQQVPTRCLALWIGLEQPDEPPTRVLLTRSGEKLQGFLVDTPKDIVTLSVEQIFPIPILIQKALRSSPLWGVGRWRDRLFLLVDLTASGKARGKHRRIEQ
jgi:chemotaxis signal transduction protein